jgi:beta-barrel assembly-enhancing protease
MKRIAALALILIVSAGAFYLAQRRAHRDTVSPDAILDASADIQHDLSRAPMQLTRLSDAEETRIGDELAQLYVSEFSDSSSGSDATEQYVASVGARVAANAKRRLNYRFHLIADRDLINAFALPGGHVFIGQGLIDQMTTEDELAFVLGHEIEHIDHFHPVERVQIEARLHSLDLDVVAALAQVPLSLWQAGYSKDQEFEADREGLRIAAVAGYSPQGAVTMLTRFQELDNEFVTHSATPADELSQVAIQSLEGYFRTHPEPSERIAQAKRVIEADKLGTARQTMPLDERYKTPNAAHDF